jgi:sugar phosphate permease
MKTIVSAEVSEQEDERLAPSRVRYRVLGLTVLAYMITYIDRVCISNAAPSIQKEFGFSIVTMGWILSSFQWSYAIFQIPSAWLGDRYGPRRTMTTIVTLWSAFTCTVTLAWNAISMAVIQFLFGTAESGSFPIATSALSRWILPEERGMAQGLTHAGARMGGAITPFLVVLIIGRWGWRAAFVACASLGVLWAAAWFWYYRDSPAEHSGVNAGELSLIQSALARDNPRRSRNIPWRQILHSRQMWILSGMYFCILGFYLVWFPTYLHVRHGFDLRHMGMYSSLVLAAGVLGDISGGSFSDFLVRQTGDLKMARRLIGCGGFLVSALCMIPASLTANPYMCLWFSCGAMFGLELTVGVSWAITLDIGEHFAGTVSSVMNTCGNLGGATDSALSGYLVKMFGWNAPFLLMVGLSFLAVLLYLRINAGRTLSAPQT